MNTIVGHLRALREKNDANDFDGFLKQEIFPPDSQKFLMVPTLCNRNFMPMSPMLRERFEFAGKWVNAAYGHTWLGLREMESPWSDEKIISHLEMRKKFYDNHLLGTKGWDKISLFGIDLEEHEETLLLWGDREEPMIYAYVGYDREEYDNFDIFLQVLLGRR